MPRTLTGKGPQGQEPSYQELWQPVENFIQNIPPLLSRGHRPLQITFEQQLKSLIRFHLEEYDSARHPLQVLKEDDFLSLLPKVLNGAVMARPSTPGAWNN